jgi:hypothetical protein
VAGADEDECEVEKVVAMKEVRRKRVFKLRYTGYPVAADKWRPEAELRDRPPAALDAFLASRPVEEAAAVARNPGAAFSAVAHRSVTFIFLEPCRFVSSLFSQSPTPTPSNYGLGDECRVQSTEVVLYSRFSSLFLSSSALHL